MSCLVSNVSLSQSPLMNECWLPHFVLSASPDCTLSTACNSEQAAAHVLGYTPSTWDNLSGLEQQPWSSIKSWAALTANEKAAVEVLGYTQVTWDNRGGSRSQPASFYKHWQELTACSDGECVLCEGGGLVAVSGSWTVMFE